jgi:hypothetical protein
VEITLSPDVELRRPYAEVVLMTCEFRRRSVSDYRNPRASAGGITGAWNWQLSAALQLLSTCPATVLNPRREAFPIHDPAAAPAQIAWEFEALTAATAIMFWFPAGPVQPIALYELGAHAARGATIAVGTDPAYARRQDVVEQLRHARPELTVHTSLPDTVRAVTELLPTTAGLTTTGR